MQIVPRTEKGRAVSMHRGFSEGSRVRRTLQRRGEAVLSPEAWQVEGVSYLKPVVSLGVPEAISSLLRLARLKRGLA